MGDEDIPCFDSNAISFTMRTPIPDVNYEMMKIEFSKDTVNNQHGTEFKDGIFTFTSKFAMVNRNEDYSTYEILGKDGNGNEITIAELRLEKFTKEDEGEDGIMYFVDGSGNKISKDMELPHIIKSGKSTTPRSLMEMKAEIDTRTGKYSVWLKLRYDEVSGEKDELDFTDADLFVKDQNFNDYEKIDFNDDKLESISGMSSYRTKAAYGGGIWIGNVVLTQKDKPAQEEDFVDGDVKKSADETGLYIGDEGEEFPSAAVITGDVDASNVNYGDTYTWVVNVKDNKEESYAKEFTANSNVAGNGKVKFGLVVYNFKEEGVIANDVKARLYLSDLETIMPNKREDV